MIKPMLCETGSLADLRRQGYVGELKIDGGSRALIIKEKGVVSIQNRHGVNYTSRMPDLVKAAEEIPRDFIIDGEIAYVNPTGEIEFTPAQRRCSTQDFTKRYKLMHIDGILLDFFTWSLLRLDGENMENWRYLEQKKVLKELVPSNSRIKYVPHRFNLEQFFQEVKERDQEGLVIKRVDGRYEHERSYSWLKIKNWRPPEVCDVVGFTAGKNSRAHFFGSLVLARDGKFTGCAGTGLNDWELRKIADLLSEAPRTKHPFDIGQPYTAVKTGLKVLVKYYKTTEKGVMRWPVFEKVIAE